MRKMAKGGGGRKCTFFGQSLLWVVNFWLCIFVDQCSPYNYFYERRYNVFLFCVIPHFKNALYLFNIQKTWLNNFSFLDYYAFFALLRFLERRHNAFYLSFSTHYEINIVKAFVNKSTGVVTITSDSLGGRNIDFDIPTLYKRKIIRVYLSICACRVVCIMWY